MKNPASGFRYELETKPPRTGPGGITRGASIKEFPVSTGIAGVSMRLEPGTMRELHWHANAAEWAYVVTGYCRTTIIHPDNTSYIDTFGPGDVWYFPKGYGHSIQAIGEGECHFILVFDNGNFSEDHTFSITDFLASMPAAIVAQNLGISLEAVAQLPKREVYFAAGNIPDERSVIAAPKEMPSLVSKHRYPLMAQEPRLIPGGGMQRTVTINEFPISATMAGSVLELQPGVLRELHWHPDADEWQYFLSGTAEMGVFLAEGTAYVDGFNAGDVGYVPMGAGHYIKNTGHDVCRVLVVFNSGIYESIDLSEWLAGNPDDVLITNLGLPAEVVKQLPKQKLFMVPAQR